MAVFLADECFSGAVIRVLQVEGFDVIRSADVCPAAADEQVLLLAYRQGRVLLTEDADFGELTVRLGLPTHGVVRCELRLLAKEARGARVVKALRELGDRVLGALVSIEPTRTRVRRLE